MPTDKDGGFALARKSDVFMMKSDILRGPEYKSIVIHDSFVPEIMDNYGQICFDLSSALGDMTLFPSLMAD